MRFALRWISGNGHGLWRVDVRSETHPLLPDNPVYAPMYQVQGAGGANARAYGVCGVLLLEVLPGL